MLGPELGNLHAQVRFVHHVLADAVHLVAEDDRIAPARLAPEILQRHGVLGLLRADDRPAFGAQAPDELEGVVGVLPGHALLRPEGHFMDLGGGGRGTDAAEVHPLRPEGVAGAESAAHVVGAADVVEHENQPGRGLLPVLVGPQAAQFNI